MTQLNTSTWNTVKEKPLAIIEFSSSWCGPCKKQKEVLSQVQQENGIFIATVDIEESADLTDEFKVKSVPTTIVMRNGQEQKRFVGNCSKETIVKELVAVAV